MSRWIARSVSKSELSGFLAVGDSCGVWGFAFTFSFLSDRVLMGMKGIV